MPQSQKGGRLMEMSVFVKSEGAGARVGGTRLEEFGFYTTASFKNLDRAAAGLDRGRSEEFNFSNP
jgi:hypothetical protein